MNYVRNRADLPVLESYKVNGSEDEIAIIFAIPNDYEFENHHAQSSAALHDEEGAVIHNTFQEDTQAVRIVYRKKKA